ncbi:MAG: helix-turn-helix transcriptional regulator [bacterium]|nr:helix-turn-helix transcriptional regulator [bacterium]
MANLHDCQKENELGATLKTARERLRLTQREVQEAVGCGISTIHYWEVGAHYPSSFRLWQKWAEAVGMKFRVTVEPRMVGRNTGEERSH